MACYNYVVFFFPSNIMADKMVCYNPNKHSFKALWKIQYIKYMVDYENLGDALVRSSLF